MRLLLVCPSWGRACGIASYTARLREGLAALGVKADVAGGPPAAAERMLRDAGYDGILMQHEYGLYYFNLVATLNTLTRAGLPLVITMHNTDNRGWMGAQHLFLFKAGAHVVVHSQAALDNLARGRPRPDLSHTSIIAMGSPDYVPTFGSREEVRAELGLAADRFTVGFFGFASQHKGIPELVAALGRLPDVTGYINAAMHPANPLAVDALYQETGLRRQRPDGSENENVVMSHRTIPDAVFGRYMNAMDLVVLPYSVHGESVSTSMMAHEALAAGRAVVATDVPYFSDLRDEVYRIPDNRPETIAEAIIYLRDNPAEREALGRRALDYAQSHSWPVVARSYLDLIARPRARRSGGAG